MILAPICYVPDDLQVIIGATLSKVNITYHDTWVLLVFSTVPVRNVAEKSCFIRGLTFVFHFVIYRIRSNHVKGETQIHVL